MDSGAIVVFTGDSLSRKPLRGSWVSIPDEEWHRTDKWHAITDSLGWALLNGVPAGAHELWVRAALHGVRSVRVQVDVDKRDTLRFWLQAIGWPEEPRGEIQFHFPDSLTDSTGLK
jgi:hypothetical protein